MAETSKHPDEISASIEATFRDVSQLNLKLLYLARVNLEWFLSSNVRLWELTVKETRKQFDLFIEMNKDFDKEIREMTHSAR